MIDMFEIYFGKIWQRINKPKIKCQVYYNGIYLAGNIIIIMEEEKINFFRKARVW